MGTLNLEKIFHPKSVAVIGARDVEGLVGYALVKNFTQLGYAEKVYFVNIREPEILGVNWW
ncbi:MAG: CoA-binding protein [Candidatus Bathyarchaeia archaeon]|jgi:acetyltransferase